MAIASRGIAMSRVPAGSGMASLTAVAPSRPSAAA
jgi:hypothetical protein